jgi:hypothetical protein
MAKLSAVDQIVWRIDADLDKLATIRGYAAANGAGASMLDKIDLDAVELKRIRAYITSSGESSEPKPKRPRGKSKRAGLPASSDNGE